LGILGKLGHVPYILKEPLAYTDYIIGLDVTHKRKERSRGVLSQGVAARYYGHTGILDSYKLFNEPMEGETFPRSFLERILPASKFKNQRILIHRDGKFRGHEKEDLYQWANQINAQIMCVEVTKRGFPRLYEKYPYAVVNCPKGVVMQLSDHEATAISSYIRDFAVAQPLYITTDDHLSLQNAVDSVFRMTVMHYGSLIPPKIPVTIHDADKIGKLLSQEIHIPQTEGKIPFWL
jgi:argonaute-like protein implicated in RNA metabolism and viral defense